MSCQDVYKDGMQFLNEIDPSATPIVQNLRSIGPALVDALVDSLYGHVYQRQGLDLKTRLLVTVACVASVGDANPQLQYQASLALKHGVDVAEIQEVLLQVAVFCGFTRAINASCALQGVFEQGANLK